MTMICLQCRSDFYPIQTQQRFCSKRCKNRESNSKIAAARKANPEAYRAYKKSLYDRDPELARKRMRDYRAANPEKMRELERRNRERNGDKLRQRCRESHHRNKEARNAKRLQWHYEHQDHANQQRSAWYAEHREESKVKSRTAFQRSRIVEPWRVLLHSAASRAKKKGMPFNLTEEWAVLRWTGNCEVSGLPFRTGLRGHGPKVFSPSIDQIEAKQGYTQDNCRFVIWAVNSLKHDGTDADMYLIAEAIFRNSPMFSKT